VRNTGSKATAARGEHAPVLPRSRLRQGTTAAQAELFFISRPGFLSQLEVADEKTRYGRISVRGYKTLPRNQVIK
jgi:hypothetical protein